MRAATVKAGYRLVRDGVFMPEPDFYEGETEVSYVANRFEKRLKKEMLPAEQEAEIVG